MHPKVVTRMTSCLAIRSLEVKLESALSVEVLAPSRSPQSSGIGPSLFLVMANDLPEVLNQLYILFTDGTKI